MRKKGGRLRCHSDMAFSVYSQVESNKTKTWLVMTFFTIFIAACSQMPMKSKSDIKVFTFEPKKDLGLILAFVLFYTFAFAEEESFTITTYYPSPYGNYNELRTNKMVIGDLKVETTPAPSQASTPLPHPPPRNQFF